MAYDTLKQIAEIPLNQAYVTHYCPEETWKTATNMFAETREAMRARITANTWMSGETKQRALEKLDNLTMGLIVPPGGNFDCGKLLAERLDTLTYADDEELEDGVNEYRQQRKSDEDEHIVV